MPETFNQIILYFYIGNIVIAFFSYMPQQKILIAMVRGKRPLSLDISATQYWIWSGANFVTTLYSILIVESDMPLIILSLVNFLHSFLTALLNSYVHFLYATRGNTP